MAFWNPGFPTLPLSFEGLTSFFLDLVVAEVAFLPPVEHDYLTLDRKGRWHSFSYWHKGHLYHRKVEGEAEEPWCYISLRSSEVEWFEEVAAWDDGILPTFHALKRVVEGVKSYEAL